jgi:hypothetical protein
MISFTKNGDELIVEGNKVKFPYPIYKAEEYNELVIVLLRFRNNDNPLDFTNALYGVSNKGQIVWKMENVQRVLGTYQPHPLVGFHIGDNKLIAFDHCARRFTIDTKDGRILSYEVGSW